MKHIILSGCCGHMGHAVTATVAERQDCDIIAGLDACEGKFDYPVYSDPAKFSGDADVIIDFSNPAFFPAILDFALARKLPAVIATTGLSGRADRCSSFGLGDNTGVFLGEYVARHQPYARALQKGGGGTRQFIRH
jgi:dihydrodipicolinate reductase